MCVIVGTGIDNLHLSRHSILRWIQMSSSTINIQVEIRLSRFIRMSSSTINIQDDIRFFRVMRMSSSTIFSRICRVPSLGFIERMRRGPFRWYRWKDSSDLTHSHRSRTLSSRAFRVHIARMLRKNMTRAVPMVPAERFLGPYASPSESNTFLPYLLFNSTFDF
ncbi:hypothetical protein DPMN_087962 [Dreissena polymorpha]|uniref:Uncharacterized protein n=1 Tax=Dreissena polymorpha TaxID=45954 RepID=A0A9D4KVB3_DREPO|nr:hypothetical protein DPMN_087962 [Dreissena polymorpha]